MSFSVLKLHFWQGSDSQRVVSGRVTGELVRHEMISPYPELRMRNYVCMGWGGLALTSLPVNLVTSVNSDALIGLLCRIKGDCA